MHGHAGGSADVDGFIQGVQKPFGLVAQVGGIVASAACHHASQGHHLIGCGEKARGIIQAARHAGSPLGHGLVQQSLHAAKFVAAGGFGRETHGGDPQGTVTHQPRDVHDRLSRFDFGRVLAIALPVDGPLESSRPARCVVHGFPGPRSSQGSQGGPAVAHYLQGHTLAEFDLARGLLDVIAVRMAVDVDETRGQG